MMDIKGLTSAKTEWTHQCGGQELYQQSRRRWRTACTAGSTEEPRGDSFFCLLLFLSYCGWIQTWISVNMRKRISSSSQTTYSDTWRSCTRDNGPQLSSDKFKDLAKEVVLKHTTSSPHNPQNNGHAERAVQTAKMILQQKDLLLSLMIYRSSLHYNTGVHPVELLMGRKIRKTTFSFKESVSSIAKTASKLKTQKRRVDRLTTTTDMEWDHWPHY